MLESISRFLETTGIYMIADQPWLDVLKVVAMLALAGDTGCTSGPSLAGKIADTFGSDIKYGFAFAAVFPVVMLILSLVRVHNENKLK